MVKLINPGNRDCRHEAHNRKENYMTRVKKAVAVILCAAIMLSAFAAFAFAANTKTETLIDTIKTKKEVSVTLTAGNTALGSSTDTIKIKGNSIAYDYNTGFFKVRVVVKDNTAYAYLPMLPFFYVKVDGLGLANVDVWSLLEKASGVTFAILDYQKSYNETINGKEYYVEEFNDRAQVTSKFCYVGDELKLLNVTDARTNSVQNTYFENISLTVSDSEIAAPAGFDLTPFLKGLFTAFLASAI